jgi:hypothetical protein
VCFGINNLLPQLKKRKAQFHMKKTLLPNRYLLALLASTLAGCMANIASAASIGTPTYL